MSQPEQATNGVRKVADEDGGAAPPVSEKRRKVKIAGRSLRAWLLLGTIFVVSLGADLISKHWAFARVADQPVLLDRATIVNDRNWYPPHHAPVVVIPKVLQFRLVLNRGAVFGIGPGQRWFFIIFTIFAVGVTLSIFAWRTRSRQVVVHAALACILAGAIGNLYDRVIFGAVRDFLNMLPEVNLPFGWHWRNGSPEIFPWVYNIADVLLLCGIGLLMLRMLWAGNGDVREPVPSSGAESEAGA